MFLLIIFKKNYYFMKWLNNLLEKWSCHHEWELVAKASYSYFDKYMFICKKCGKIKKKKL